MAYYDEDTPRYAEVYPEDEIGDTAPDTSEALREQIRAWYRQYLKREPADEEVERHLGNPGGMAAIEALIRDAAATELPPEEVQAPPGVSAPPAAERPSPPLAAPPLAAPPLAAPPLAAPGPIAPQATPRLDPVDQIISAIPREATAAGPGAPNFYPDVPTFEYPSFAPAPFTAPTFQRPDEFSYPDYVLPTGEEVLAEDPGYGFRRDEGLRGLTYNKAAEGILKTGGTLKSLMDYAQGLAQQEYGAAEGRRFRNYSTNRAGKLEEHNQRWRDRLADFGLRYGTETDAYNRASDLYKTNLGTTATKYGFGLDVAAGKAGGRQGASTLAGNLALGGGNLALGKGQLDLGKETLGFNRQNQQWRNLLDLYNISTAALPNY